MKKNHYDDNFYIKLLGLKTILFNPNPKQTFSAKTNLHDCLTRALCAYEGKSWREVADNMAKYSFDNGYMPGSMLMVSNYLSHLGYKDINSPKNYETFGEFAYENKDDKYLVILGAARSYHVLCYAYGTIIDSRTGMDYINGILITDNFAVMKHEDDF